MKFGKRMASLFTTFFIFFFGMWSIYFLNLDLHVMKPGYAVILLFLLWGRTFYILADFFCDDGE